MTEKFKKQIRSTIQSAIVHKTKEIVTLTIYPKAFDNNHWFLFKVDEPSGGLEYTLEAIGSKNDDNDAPTDLIGSRFTFDELIELLDGCCNMSIANDNEYYDDEDFWATIYIADEKIVEW